MMRSLICTLAVLTALALGAVFGRWLLDDTSAEGASVSQGTTIPGLPETWVQPPPPVDWRTLKPHDDPAIGEEINQRLNFAMDLIEGTENPGQVDRIEYLITTAIDDALHEQTRRWTLYAIGRVLDEADLPDSDRGRLAQSYLDVIGQKHGSSTPALRFSTRARIIQNELYIYEEFLKAIEAVENDPEVLAYLFSQGIEPGWLAEPGKKGASIKQSKSIEWDVLAATAETDRVVWRYSTDEPSDDGKWFTREFDDSAWIDGEAPFGVRGTPGVPGGVIRTEWSTSSIWLRRKVKLDDIEGEILFRVLHNDDALVYVNGLLACDLRGFVRDYKQHHMSPIARAALVKGENLIAVRCRQVKGPQAIDLGIVRLKPENDRNQPAMQPMDRPAGGE